MKDEEKQEISPMRKWARENNLEGLYDQFLSEIEDLNEEYDGYLSPNRNDCYEIRVAEIEARYPELFSSGDDEEDEDDDYFEVDHTNDLYIE